MIGYQKYAVTWLLGITSGLIAGAQTTSMQGSPETVPTEISVTADAISILDSIAMEPYLNVERSSKTRLSAQPVVVQEISITKDAVPLVGDSLPSAIKRSVSGSSKKASVTSISPLPVDAIPVTGSLPMVTKVAVRNGE